MTLIKRVGPLTLSIEHRDYWDAVYVVTGAAPPTTDPCYFHIKSRALADRCVAEWALELTPDAVFTLMEEI